MANRNFVFLKAASNYHNIHRVSCDDIIAFEAKGNYVIVHLPSENLKTYLSLSTVMQFFSADTRFLQLHRSYIISVRHIRFIKRSQVVMDNGLSFKAGDAYLDLYTDMVKKNLISNTHKL